MYIKRINIKILLGPNKYVNIIIDTFSCMILFTKKT
jgi:hypothetical protein